ncbi:MAG: DUF1428 family protein [Xanthomonadales bacterium]|nr:DUF1428 family protein [Xanthomonadales bacterium]
MEASVPESLCIGFLHIKSRKDRDRIMAAVMNDKRFAGMDPDSMPFNPMRMFYGGFEVMVRASAG